MELATLAGGCFWCTEAVFQKLNGVESVTPGYTGGQTDNPTYEEVSTGETGHAEAIQIEFDPQIVSYETLLEVFWQLHDPTTLNQQGADHGTQYRSAIFYHNDKQKELAEKSLEQIARSGMYSDPIVTEIVPFEKFYPAEEEHRNFYENNPNQPYCRVVIDPKITKLFKKFDSLIKEEEK
jgi:peptide-methionine (S)-S-oxide reductase